MRKNAWILLTVAISWNCSASAPPPKEPEAFDPSYEEEEPTLERENPPTASPRPESTGTDDYELSHSDCSALSKAYGQAWRHEELTKLGQQNLQPAAHEKAAAEIEKGAAEMRDNWRDECEKTVGTAYRRENLTCAMKARTLEAFDDCWYGRTP